MALLTAHRPRPTRRGPKRDAAADPGGEQEEDAEDDGEAPWGEDEEGPGGKEWGHREEEEEDVRAQTVAAPLGGDAAAPASPTAAAPLVVDGAAGGGPDSQSPTTAHMEGAKRPRLGGFGGGGEGGEAGGEALP